MSEVALSIGGRSYKVACAPGEEERVARLAATIDAKLQAMPQRSPQDAENLLFAALLMADELHDARSGGSAPQQEAAHDSEEFAALRAEAERLREENQRMARKANEADEQRQALEQMRGEVDELGRGEAALREELEAVKTSERELRERLAGMTGAREGVPASSAEFAPAADPELAPALERFAELLEICADKLESKPASS